MILVITRAYVNMHKDIAVVTVLCHAFCSSFQLPFGNESFINLKQLHQTNTIILISILISTQLGYIRPKRKNKQTKVTWHPTPFVQTTTHNSIFIRPTPQQHLDREKGFTKHCLQQGNNVCICMVQRTVRFLFLPQREIRFLNSKQCMNKLDWYCFQSFVAKHGYLRLRQFDIKKEKSKSLKINIWDYIFKF